MSKCGQDFEEAVYAFVQTLDPAAEVLFDHEVRDRDTNTPQQCDVWINAKFGGHWPISILVSCKDHTRKLDIGDIRTFNEEVRSARASTGVIYSRSGFTKPALDKAKLNGLSCCRLYRDESADIPQALTFEYFLCKTSVKLVLKTDLSASNLSTWNDLFAIPCNQPPVETTVLQAIENAYRDGEQWALSQMQESDNFSFPPNWISKLEFQDEEPDKTLHINVYGIWKRYKAKMEASLLNGSYCFTGDTFSGAQRGPIVDTQSSNVGDEWEKIEDDDLGVSGNRAIIILYGSHIKETLQEGLGHEKLAVVNT